MEIDFRETADTVAPEAAAAKPAKRRPYEKRGAIETTLQSSERL